MLEYIIICLISLLGGVFIGFLSYLLFDKLLMQISIHTGKDAKDATPITVIITACTVALLLMANFQIFKAF